VDKKRLSNIKKAASIIIIILIFSSILFLISSCKSDYQKALGNSSGGDSTNSVANENESGLDSNTSTDTSKSQDNNSGKETAEETQGNTTETTISSETAANNNAQVIEVIVSGGYSPTKINAKADVPTILVMNSQGAYGCERAFNIPDLNIGKILPENGQTSFELGALPKGTKLLGVCSMGMYSFVIFFS